VTLFKSVLLILLSLLLLTGCGIKGEDGEVSDSNSSSETGGGFTVVDDTTHSHAASVVIGQKTFDESDEKNTSAESATAPHGNPTVVDGMLYLPDSGSNRVLGYNSVPTRNGVWADFVIGQRNLVSSYTGSSEYQMMGARTVTVAEGRLFVTDSGNNRILIFDHRPLSAPARADTVVGQEAFYRSLPGLSDNRLRLPESLCVAGDRLIVADSGNNRVLIWNAIPLTDGEAADIVLGQEDFDSNTTLEPPTAASLNFPTALWSDGSILVVLDAGNNRVLVWDSLNTLISGDDADAVIGQKDFISNEPNMGLAAPSEYTLHISADGGGLYANGSQLFVTDSANHRLLIWDFPLTTEQAASGLIGQDDYNLSEPNRGGVTGDDTFLNPTGVYQFYDQLIVTDTGNNRYLIFDSNN